MESEAGLIPKGWWLIEECRPPFKCAGCGSGGNSTGWRRERDTERLCDSCGPLAKPAKEAKVPLVKRVLTSTDGSGKKRGRPKGSANKKKEEK